MAEGYIKLYRSLLDHWIWTEKPFSKGQAWIDLLLLANHKDVKAMRKDQVITYRRGTVNMSITTLAQRWGWNRKTAAKFIKALESDGMVTVTRSYKWTTVSIENYSVFQASGSTKRTTERTTEGNIDGQLTGHRTIMTNNDNNVNKGRSRGSTHKSFMQKRKEAWENLPAEWYEGEEDNEISLQDGDDRPEDGIYG